MAHARVAVVRVTESIGEAVRHGIGLLGGIERYVRPGALVAIKVNMFTRAVPESGKVTHPAVVLEVARLCHACGARVVVIEQSPHYDLIFKGYEEIARYAELVSLDTAEHRHISLSGARTLAHQVPWPTIVDACDVFINIPGLRTHALTKFSNGMKNLMGLMPDMATRYVHQYGLDGSICDLNYRRPSDLVITDAVYTLEGNFPSEGTPVRTDLITVADNVVAADLVGTRIVGQDPAEVFHLQEAIARRMGPANLDAIELVGDDLAEATAGVRIAPAPRDPEPYCGQHRLLADWVCASCRQALAGGLLAASHRPSLAAMEGVTIIAGPQTTEPQVEGGRALIYGNCAYRYRHLGHYEPGCPPLAYQVGKGLDELLVRPMRAAMCSIAWRDEAIEDVAPRVAAAGYAGIEVWGPHVDRLIAEGGRVEALAQQLRDLGLEVPMVSAYFDLVDDLEGSLATADRVLGYCRALDAPLLRVFTGGGNSAEASIGVWRAVVAGLQRMGAMAAAVGVTLALETHDGHLHDTTDSTLRLIRQANVPHLAVNLDICNLYARGEDPVAALKRLEPYVRILHLKNVRCEGGRWQSGLPLEDGAMDYQTFLAALADSRYDGYVSVEWFGPAPDAAAVSELAYLRRVLGGRLEGKDA